MSTGVQTLLSASLGSLYNVFIDFSLGITDDTSAPARVKKDLPHLSRIVAHNRPRMCVGMRARGSTRKDAERFCSMFKCMCVGVRV